MKAPGARRAGAPAGCGFVAALCLFSPPPALSQDSATVDARVDPPPAVRIAASERAFDRLDAEAGLRSGGSFPFDYQHLVYYPATGGQAGSPETPVDLWTTVSVQADRVRPVFDGGWQYSLDMTVELSREDRLVESASSRTSLTLAAPLPEDDARELGFPIHAGMRVPPGEYDYLIRIRDNGWEGERSTNERRGTLVVPRPISTRPFISSIAIAVDSGGTWKPAPGVELQLNAARIVYGDARPYIYFEVYGLTPGADYRGDVRLVSRRITRSAEDVLDGNYQPFQLQYRGSVPEDPGRPVRRVLRLDLEKTRPGPYEVQVRVRDLVTGQTSQVRSARLKVQPEPSHQPLQPVADSNGDPNGEN